MNTVNLGLIYHGTFVISDMHLACQVSRELLVRLKDYHVVVFLDKEILHVVADNNDVVFSVIKSIKTCFNNVYAINDVPKSITFSL